MTDKQKVSDFVEYQKNKGVCFCEKCIIAELKTFEAWLDGYATGHDVAIADSTKDQDLKITDAFHEGEVEGRRN